MSFDESHALLLGRLEEGIKNIGTDLKVVSGKLDDHGTRITKIETSRATIWKAITIAGSIVAIIGGFVGCG